MKTNSVIMTTDCHKNKNKYNSASRSYYMCYVVDNRGTLTPCMLTEDDVMKGVERSIKNPEDILKLSLWQRMFSKLISLFA